TIADGIDAGYFQYLAMPNGSSSTFELLNGGPPYGSTLPLWFKDSPEFNLDKVEAPIRIEAHGLWSVLEGWGWFSSLSHIGKPVDFIYLPNNAAHILERPWERMVSQGGDVDWFCFWLKGEEDPDPAKAEQYKRWRELRKLQEANDKKPAETGTVKK